MPAPPPIKTPGDIVDFFYPRPLVGQERSNLAFHIERYAYLLDRVGRLLEQRTAAGRTEQRLLDVGVSQQTLLLQANHPAVPVDTLDLFESGRELRPGERHYVFDLNRSADASLPAEAGPYDVIVLAEVIEHLHLDGSIALRALADRLADGGFVFLQTPNAVALHKRLKHLIGRNPAMELTSENATSPHFHEYTVAELRRAAERAGLRTVDVDLRNYFTRPTALSKTYNAVAQRLHPSLRAGISMTLQKV